MADYSKIYEEVTGRRIKTQSNAPDYASIANEVRGRRAPLRPQTEPAHITQLPVAGEGPLGEYLAPRPIRKKLDILKELGTGQRNFAGSVFELATGVRPRDFVREVVNTVAVAPMLIGEALGTAAALRTRDYDELQKARFGEGEMRQKLFEKIRQKRVTGGDTTRLENFLKQQTMGATDEQMFPGLKITTSQIAAAGVQTVLDIATAGTYGLAVKGAKTFQLVGKTKPTLVSSLMVKTPPKFKDVIFKTGKELFKQVPIGYAYDVTTGKMLREDDA